MNKKKMLKQTVDADFLKEIKEFTVEILTFQKEKINPSYDFDFTINGIITDDFGWFYNESLKNNNIVAISQLFLVNQLNFTNWYERYRKSKPFNVLANYFEAINANIMLKLNKNKAVLQKEWKRIKSKYE